MTSDFPSPDRFNSADQTSGVDPFSGATLRPDGTDSDERLDAALRPRSFAEFVGQSDLVDNLSLFIRAASERGEPLDHLLLSGLPGLGKTTLAHIIAREMGSQCRATSGPALVRPADLAGLLTNLAVGDVLFIDEIHRLPATVEEVLYSAMEDFEIDILIDQGPSARSVKVPIQRFTLVGATTREGQLSAPFRSRFGLMEKVRQYAVDDLARIVTRSAERLQVGIDQAAAQVIAGRARGTPRIANRLVKRVRDFAQVDGDGNITEAVALTALTRLGIDGNGFGETDRRLLLAMHRAGRPVGLKGLAVAVGEEEATVEDVYEPFLLTEGWMLRTPRGRCLTARGAEWAQKAAGTAPPQGSLF